MSQYTEALQKRTWSYSSVHQYDDCPRGFFLQRIEHVPQKNNAFALYGSFVHEILEKYFKGLIAIPEMEELYITDYESRVNLKFPQNRWSNLAESYYQDGLRFLQNFKGLNENFRVLGAELEVRLPVGGFKTIGYIDLLLENTQTGQITVVDHKSKKKFASRKEELDYRRQLLFYGIYVKHLLGRYPDFVDFDLFRSQQHIIAPFEEAECTAVQDWFVKSIESACQDEVFQDKIERRCYENFQDLSKFKKDDFFCNEICSVRASCPRSTAYKKPRKKRASTK